MRSLNVLDSFLNLYGRRYDKPEPKFSDLLYEIKGLFNEELRESKLIIPTLLMISLLGKVKAINVNSEMIVNLSRGRCKFKKRHTPSYHSN